MSQWLAKAKGGEGKHEIHEISCWRWMGEDPSNWCAAVEVDTRPSTTLWAAEKLNASGSC